MSATTPCTDVAGRRAAVALAFAQGVGCVAYRERVGRYGSAAAAFEDTIAGAARAAALARADQVLEATDRVEAQLLVLGEAGYPAALLDLRDPPSVLFMLGDPSVLDSAAVAIVGTRHASAAAERISRRLAGALVRAGACIVSGMAHGIDGAAHRGALDAGGTTVGVLGGGVDVAYPAGHRALYDVIRSRGALVSEAPPGAPPAAGAFPRRNRIIAALARAVIVVEAGERSGALITANHALELARGVAAVPGSIDGPQCAGSNALLRDGATIITSPEDALVLAGLALRAPRAPLGARTRRSASRPAAAIPLPSTSSTRMAASPRDPHESRVLQAVSAGASDLASLVQETRLAPRDATAALAALELSGILWTDHAGGIRLAR